MCYDSVFTTSYINVADMDVLEVGYELSFLDSILRLLGTYVVVPVSGLESDGVACDVGHIDMVDEDVLSLSASLDSTLETKSCVCALEGVVAYQDVLHATRELASNDETAMSVIYGVVLNVDILARTCLDTAFASSSLHADTVVARINDVVDDEYILTA